MSPSDTSKAMSYGFIGLGAMGYGMAKNLKAKIPSTCSLYVCEVIQTRRDQFISESQPNTFAASSPADVARHCDIIITMLPKGQHVRNVFMEPTTGLLSALRDGQPRRPKLFLECSTIDVKTSLEIGEAVSKHSTADYLDAPVSGGVHGANNGTLTFMVGGPRQVFDDATTVLAYMGKAENIFHCGAAGAGLATKQINNYMSATNMIAVCEGMNMGRLYGLDPKVLAKVVNASTGMSRNSREQNPVKGISDSASAATNFEGGFSTELCHGVIEMSVGLAQQLKAKTVLSSIVDEFYRSAVMHPKCKCKDFRSIYRLFEEDEDMIDSTST